MPVMETSAAVEVAVPAQDAFAFVADATNNPRWQKGMVDCTWLADEPPIGVGSRYRQHARFMGRDVRSIFEVTEYVDGQVIAARTLRVDEGGVAGGFPITFRRSVEPVGEGRCRVRTVVTGEPGRFFGLAAGPLAWMVRRSIRGDYQRLVGVLES